MIKNLTKKEQADKKAIEKALKGDKKEPEAVVDKKKKEIVSML